MKCYHCNTELNWESDSTDEDDSRLMLTFLSCHNCPTTVVITHQTSNSRCKNPMITPKAG